MTGPAPAVFATAPRVSVVTPAYNESANERLRAVLDALPEPAPWEWIVIDDHSADNTFQVVCALAARDPRVRGVRLARNSGSHTALAYGLHHCRGDCAVVLAADLQDPPEILPDLITGWKNGAQIVWAVRAGREGEAAQTVAFSRLYYWLMRRVVGMKELPPTGADFFLLDRAVLDAFRGFRESNTSILALLTWMGFRQTSISYVKQARVHGRSGWTFAKKLKLVVDSVTAFTFLPIRVMSYGGLLVALAGFAYAVFVIIHALTGSPTEGWSSLMVVVLVMGGIQMLMMGVLGEYLWRALDESRRRPRYLIEAVTPSGPTEAGDPTAPTP